jgi:hypothetical protein
VEYEGILFSRVIYKKPQMRISLEGLFNNQ